MIPCSNAPIAHPPQENKQWDEEKAPEGGSKGNKQPNDMILDDTWDDPADQFDDDESSAANWDSGDDDAWGDLVDNDAANIQGKQKKVLKNYTILTQEELAAIREKEIEKICSLIFNDTSPHSKDQASALLIHYNWNTSKLQEQYFENSEEILKKAGIGSMATPCTTQSDELHECPQCYDDFTPNQLFSLTCGHKSCKECWEEYLEFKNSEGVRGLNAKCNHQNCNLLVPQTIWEKMLSQAGQDKRKRWQLMAFVESQKNIEWCPGKGCHFAVKSLQRDGDGNVVDCKCGHSFCFKCGEVGHRPAPCKWARAWLEKCSSEAENANWIMANTKRCPKCNTQIEKNQGCNHMTCFKCKHDFCWLCKGKWSDHGSATGGYYRCNRYEESKKAGVKTTEETESESAANSLQKYLHYYSRFDNHAKAREMAIKSIEETNQRMTTLRHLKGGGFNDVAFLEKAVHVVIKCRRVLQWTYAMGYYMPEGKEKNLFEHLQEMLEKNTEYLHGLSEKSVEDLVQEKIRQDVNNYTRVTQNFLNGLIEGVESGLTEKLADV